MHLNCDGSLKSHQIVRFNDTAADIVRMKHFVLKLSFHISLQQTYEAKRQEFLGELQRREEEMRQTFVQRVKEKEAELKDAEREVRHSRLMPRIQGYYC